ncbi:MAG: N-acetylmuramoyl-L-alanine amidase [Phycisphaerales bacterium]
MATSAIGLIDRLVIHHSASPLITSFEDIVAWHTKPKPEGRGWPFIGYHWVILADGSMRVGRPMNVRGAHAPPNRGRLGVCLVGNNVQDGEGWTIEQIGALRRHIDAVRLLIPDVVVSGHRDVMPAGHTVCPGLDVRSLLLEG